MKATISSMVVTAISYGIIYVVTGSNFILAVLGGASCGVIWMNMTSRKGEK